MKGMARTMVCLVAGVCVTTLACGTDPVVGGVRFSNDPPDFERLPPEKVRSTMWVLAAEIEKLEQLLRTRAQRPTEAQRAAVRGVLSRMRAAAGNLDQAGRSSQHPMVDDNLVHFTDRLDRALRNVDRDPPNYYLASTIAGACFMCHGETSQSVWRAPSAADRPPVAGRSAFPAREARLAASGRRGALQASATISR